MMAVIAIPELHLVKRFICDNAIGGFTLLLFLRGFTLLLFRGLAAASEAHRFMALYHPHGLANRDAKWFRHKGLANRVAKRFQDQ